MGQATLAASRRAPCALALCSALLLAPARADEPGPDTPAAILDGARSFDGRSVGFGQVVTRPSRALDRLVARGANVTFENLLESANPAARLYGVEGLVELETREALEPILALLDDESPVATFLHCEFSRSTVAVEVYRRLPRLLSPPEMDLLGDRIFREGYRLGGEPATKLHLALERARRRPTPASLGFLFHQYRDVRRAVALLEVNADRTRLGGPARDALSAAVESPVLEIRLAGLGLLARAPDTTFLTVVLPQCRDGRPAVASAALGALGALTLASLEARSPAAATAASGESTVEVCLEESTRALTDSRSGRRIATDVLIALARRIGEIPPGSPPPPIAPGEHEHLLRALATAVPAAAERQPAMASLLARLDGAGEVTASLLLQEYGDLDPRAFSILVHSTARTVHRSRLVRHALSSLNGSSGAWKTRLYSVRALGEIEEASALPALEELLASEEVRLAREAREAVLAIRRSLEQNR